MIDWDTGPERMISIRQLTRPVQTDLALRDVLAHDFPNDCASLPISGGWGYSKGDAIVICHPAPLFVQLEYHIAQKIIYEELIIFQKRTNWFSGIEMDLARQDMLADEANRRFDRLQFSVSCWSDWHWNRLKREWEEGGLSSDFDMLAHVRKREDSRVKYDRDFWFDITDVFGQPKPHIA